METNVLQTLLDMQIDNTQYYKNETKKLREENEKLKKRISKLSSENYKLQNGLISQQMIEYETNEYINILKNELFQAYMKQQTT